MVAAESHAGAHARWYLVHAQTGREALAETHLKRQGFRPFVPMTWRTIRHARRINNVRSAFFPGYLFVPLNLERDRWRSIDGTIGVIRLVKAGDRPLSAPASLVESLQAKTQDDGTLDRAGGELAPGQRVRLIRGPFAEQLARVERMNGADRVRVLLAIMNQAVPVELYRNDLAVA